MKRMVISLICVFTLHAACAEPELRGSPQELSKLLSGLPNTVRISGESDVKVQADRARISIKLTVTAKELATALRSLQQLRTRFISDLNTREIPSDAILGGKFSFTQKTAVFSDKVKSHTVNDLLKVTIKNEKEFQAVADAIDAVPEAQYLEAVFERSDKDAIQARAVANACDKANERKAVFEEKLGLRLTPRAFVDPAVTEFAIDNFAAQRLITSGLRDSSSYSRSNEALLTHATVDDQSGFGEMTFKARVIVEYTTAPK